MTLSWTDIDEDIIVQEGTSAYNFRASGSIEAGQLVVPNGSISKECFYVIACSDVDSTAVVGVAAYDVTIGEYVAIWGPGNIIRTRCSGAVTVGDDLQSASSTEDGYVAHRTAAAGAKVGVALESKTADTTNGKTIRVLLT